MLNEGLQPDENGPVKAAIVAALDNGADPNALIRMIIEESGKRQSRESKEAEGEIRETLKAYIDDHKVQLSTQEDFEALRQKRREHRNWRDIKDTNVLEGHVNYFFKEWVEGEVGKAYLKSNDESKVRMLYKGSNNELFEVEFDLDRFLINGETINRDILQLYLERYAPFKTIVKTSDWHGREGDPKSASFIKFVDALYATCEERKKVETNKVARETREELAREFQL